MNSNEIELNGTCAGGGVIFDFAVLFGLFFTDEQFLLSHSVHGRCQIADAEVQRRRRQYISLTTHLIPLFDEVRLQFDGIFEDLRVGAR